MDHATAVFEKCRVICDGVATQFQDSGTCVFAECRFIYAGWLFDNPDKKAHIY